MNEEEKIAAESFMKGFNKCSEMKIENPDTFYMITKIKAKKNDKDNIEYDYEYIEMFRNGIKE